VGSIEAGKDADIDIYDKDPLSVYAVAQKVLIDGQVYFDRKQDIAHRAELEREKKALMEKEKKAAESARPQGPRGNARRPGPPATAKPPGAAPKPQTI
jgi:hypothetical protein